MFPNTKIRKIWLTHFFKTVPPYVLINATNVAIYKARKKRHYFYYKVFL